MREREVLTVKLTTITQAAKDMHMPVTTLRDRLKKLGVPVWKLGNYSLVYDTDVVAALQPQENTHTNEVESWQHRL